VRGHARAYLENAGDLHLIGGPDFARTLIEAGLAEEGGSMIDPLVVGGGKALPRDAAPQAPSLHRKRDDERGSDPGDVRGTRRVIALSVPALPFGSSSTAQSLSVSGSRVKFMSIHGCQVVPSSDRSHSACIEEPSSETVRIDRTRSVGASPGCAGDATSEPPEK
jgi:hypothetical protein